MAGALAGLLVVFGYTSIPGTVYYPHKMCGNQMVVTCINHVGGHMQRCKSRVFDWPTRVRKCVPMPAVGYCIRSFHCDFHPGESIDPLEAGDIKAI